MKKRLLISFALILIFTALLVGCDGNAADSNSGEIKPLQVYASFYPLYDFAQKIGGDAVEVHNIMPPGAESHDFEPTPKDMVALAEADLFIYNGSGFEAWAEKAIETLDGEKTNVVNTTEQLDLMTNEESGHVHGEENHDHDGEHGEEDHGHGTFDPHVWLDPNLAKQQAEMIKDALVEIDPDNAETYEANFTELAGQFDELDQKLRDVTANAERKEIVVSHAAFGYLTHQYGLEQIAVSGLSPSDEPSQKELQAIVEFAKEHNVNYIMFETLVSSKVADAVKNEVGAEALTLNPLENLTKEEMERGEDYFSIMEQNIQNIEKALSS